MLLAACSLIGCGDAENGEGLGSSVDGSPFSNVIATKKNRLIGYIINFQDGYALLKIADKKKKSLPFVEIDLDSGDYRAYPNVRSSVIYFAKENCRGKAVIEKFSGEVGNTIIHIKNGSFMRLKKFKDYSKRPFSYNSQLTWTGDCMAATGTFNRSAGLLKKASRPYEFSKIAPLDIEYR
jgi:hypothetical protein